MTKSNKFFLERSNDEEFPLMRDGNTLSMTRLLLMIVGAFFAEFLALIPQTFFPSVLKSGGNWIVLYQILVPLIGFFLIYKYIGNQQFSNLYKRIKLKDLGFGIIMMILSTAYSSIVVKMIHGSANINNSAFENGTRAVRESHYFHFMGENLVALMNEELMAIIPFLAAMVIANKHFHLSRNASIWIGLLVSIIVFGTGHYSAYNWNIAQMYLVIGASRLFDTGIYIRTKNIWISFIMHWVFDAVMFGMIAFK
ncbi:CPBP family intramembrane glutamic endopeptidase [Lentilactobacillus sp. Marseille-Q4993]|uniref:CPBP family intramembrane glutamic endopeptidase n=1 Tax=Lentilactobacillus sp. Marseille-Q4993 TaxID=3039492 RepID=UPI0024BBEFA6|nr:CPBP family intramembrane glutamic endopeptidase [Lentilactobacillus sp. Marseille-Q4993]